MTLEDKIQSTRLHVLQRAKSLAMSVPHAVKLESHAHSSTVGGDDLCCMVLKDCIRVEQQIVWNVKLIWIPPGTEESSPWRLHGLLGDLGD